MTNYLHREALANPNMDPAKIARRFGHPALAQTPSNPAPSRKAETKGCGTCKGENPNGTHCD